MPWYYAGPEAKPVGPISLEELHARRLSGTILPETYVIEHTGQPNDSITWKRYREVFPSSPNLPLPLPPPAPPAPQRSPAQPHPLFPSAASVPGGPSPSPFPSTPRPDPYYATRKNNPWCIWGFVLGLIGFCFALVCGIGFFSALPGLFLCIVGLAQVHKHPEQAGRGLAISGLVLSSLGLLIALIFFACFAIPVIKAHEQTTTEQTSNDSE